MTGVGMVSMIGSESCGGVDGASFNLDVNLEFFSRGGDVCLAYVCRVGIVKNGKAWSADGWMSWKNSFRT